MQAQSLDNQSKLAKYSWFQNIVWFFWNNCLINLKSFLFRLKNTIEGWNISLRTKFWLWTDNYTWTHFMNSSKPPPRQNQFFFLIYLNSINLIVCLRLNTVFKLFNFCILSFKFQTPKSRYVNDYSVNLDKLLES